MKRTAKILFNIACIIGVIVAVWHFFVPYSSKWFSYIPDVPLEIKVQEGVRLELFTY